MIIGFTGTQQDLARPQKETLVEVLIDFVSQAQNRAEDIVAHHGSCVGADDFFHACMGQLREIVRSPNGVSRITIHSHPSNIRSKTAKHRAEPDVVHPAKPPLDRNPDIVRPADVLIACPKEFEEELRSGTWTTVREARKLGIRIIFVWPDGSQTEEAAAENRLE